MSKLIPVASCLILLAFIPAGVGALDQGLAPVPLALVTAPVVDARIAEAQADPRLNGEAKSTLVALYRQALSNLQEVETNRARADAFAEQARSALNQTQLVRERMAADLHADAQPALGVGAQTPLDRIEVKLKQAQADRAAADARRAELERQLAYQQNRPAAIRVRLKEAQEEQDAITTALQSEPAGEAGAAIGSDPSSGPSPNLMQAKRWALETRAIALSTEIGALDQELIGLPLSLDLIAARRDAESADKARIEQRVEGLRALVNARHEAEAREAQVQAERLVQASAGLDPALVRLAGQNAALVADLAAIAEQGDPLDAEQQQAEGLSARIQASFKRTQTAKAVGMPTEGLGPFLLGERAALPDVDRYVRRARDLEQEFAAVNLNRLRHQEEIERRAGRSSACRTTGRPSTRRCSPRSPLSTSC
jgi:potassium efflux system protein